MQTNNYPPIPLPLKILSILLILFGFMALFGSLFLWGQGFILTFPPGVNLGFPAADLIINTPATLLTAAALWKQKKSALPLSFFTAGFYLYASVAILVEAFQTHPPDFLAILIPQIIAVIVALGLMFYAWKYRWLFLKDRPPE